MAQLARVRTSVLDIAYEHSGTPEAMPVVLLHGYPYDPRAFDEVVTIVTAAGFRAIVPYLRGYGPTRFLSSDTPRSGEQAAVDAVNISGAGPDRSAMSGFGLTIWRADSGSFLLAICRDEFGGNLHNFSGASVGLVQIEASVDGSPDASPLSLRAH